MKGALLKDSVMTYKNAVRRDKSLAIRYQDIKAVVNHIVERGPGLFKSGFATYSKDPAIFDLGCSYFDARAIGKYQQKKIDDLIDSYK
jgi:hypothetical protein